MAAISTQDKAWKQQWMERAEKITDIWDIFKAWCGRSAEVVLSICMFVSIIGVLPGVHYWTWVGNLILSVQIIMLDMGGFALNTLAENARDNGQEEAAQKAEKMGRFLIQLVIATLALITIGQLAGIAGPYAQVVRQIVEYIETSLILVRVVSTVAYIHTIHSLRGSTLSVQSVAQTETDYDEMARHLLPLLTSELQALIPAQQPIDYQVIAQQIETRITTVVEERLTNLLPAPRDNDATLSAPMAQQMNEIEATTSATKAPVRVARTGTTTARQKALKLITKNPDIEPGVLARKAEITTSYARKILAEQKG